MPVPLNYRPANVEPPDRFHWGDFKPAIGIQSLALPDSLCMGWIVIWAVAFVGYWIAAVIIMVVRVNRSRNPWAQVFVKWGFLMIFVGVLVSLIALVIVARW